MSLRLPYIFLLEYRLQSRNKRPAFAVSSRVFQFVFGRRHSKRVFASGQPKLRLKRLQVYERALVYMVPLRRFPAKAGAPLHESKP